MASYDETKLEKFVFSWKGAAVAVVVLLAASALFVWSVSQAIEKLVGP